MTLLIVAALAVAAFLFVGWPLLRRPLLDAAGEPPETASGRDVNMEEVDTDVQLGLLTPDDAPRVAEDVAGPERKEADDLAQIERELAARRESRRSAPGG
ncbi:MAG: hypothetical protein EXR60_03800 [Dehalococcoidia bacterium]|nr:hypothetical protein [Dehalococcoidia bacterium]